MTGLVGLLNRDGRPADGEIVARMAARIAHRGRGGTTATAMGPFAAATLHASSCGPADDGRGADGALVAACGDLHNIEELRRTLAEAGHVAPASLPGLLLAVYRAWGLGGFARCNGAFVVAIWEPAAARLVLARDPIGLAPVFYRLDEKHLVFGSEAKAVLAHPDCPKAPDEVEIAHYLGASRYFLQTGRSFYRGISRLIGGTALVLERGKCAVSRYWAIDPGHRLPVESDAERVAATRALLLDSVRIRAEGVDRLGAALSGGFDSSSVVCAVDMLARTEGRVASPIDTFSFDFGSSDADEIELIRLVSNRVRSRHHHIDALDPGLLDDVAAATEANDGPILESAILLLWNKKRRASEVGIDVLLSGLGGDELFMGRLNFMADLLRAGRLPSLLHELRGVYPYDRSTGKRVSLRKILVAYLFAPLEPWWLKDLRKRRMKAAYPPAWITPELARSSGLAAGLPRPGADLPVFDSVFDQDCFEVFHYELRPTLEIHEAVSAPFGIRTRFPLLDIRLIERMFATPREWKIRDGKVRIMQKQAMQDILPPEIVADHLKKDFHPTLEKFLRDQYHRLLTPMLAQGDLRSAAYVDWRGIEQLLAAFMAGRGKSYPLWCAYSLESWLRREF